MGPNIFSLNAEDIAEVHACQRKINTKHGETNTSEDSQNHQLNNEKSCIGDTLKYVFCHFYISIIKPAIGQGFQCLDKETDTSFPHNNINQNNNHSQEQDLFDSLTMIDISSESMCLADMYQEELIFGLYCTKSKEWE